MAQQDQESALSRGRARRPMTQGADLRLAAEGEATVVTRMKDNVDDMMMQEEVEQLIIEANQR